MKITQQRYVPLDVIRGVSIAYVIFIHAAIYNYYDLPGLLGSEVPIALLLLGLAGLWGGVFVVHSLIVNTVSMLRSGANASITFNAVKYLFVTSLFYIFILGAAQTLLLGRWSTGSTGDTELSLVAQLLRGQDVTLYLDKLVTGSGIKSIGFVLLIVPVAIYLVFKRTGLRNRLDYYGFIAALGCTVLLLSFIRIFLYEGWVVASQNGDYVSSLMGSLLLADPYPGLAYVSYGFFGVVLGMMLYYRRKDLVKRYVLPSATIALVAGLLGMVTQPVSIFGASWFWYFKFIAETGLFAIIFVVAILVSLKKRVQQVATVQSVAVRRIQQSAVALSRISLSAYMLETFTSELLRHAWFLFSATWEQSLLACAILGVVNIALWVGIAVLWQRWQFKYSMEWWIASMLKAIGKKSTRVAV